MPSRERINGRHSGYFHLPPAISSKDLNQAEQSLERLLEYDFDAGLVVHGSSVTENATEILDRYRNFPGNNHWSTIRLYRCHAMDDRL